MFDQETAALIRATPPLAGLDRESLPEFLTNAFAEIAAARVRLRETGSEAPETLQEILEQTRRLAYTNEALVSILPERDNRSSAAFVAATAHQLCFNAELIDQNRNQKTLLGARSISSDLASMLLFLVAEATADAGDIARSIKTEADGSIEHTLIISLCDLATGRLQTLIGREFPNAEIIASELPSESGVRALYREILRGVRILAEQLLAGASETTIDVIEVFRRVRLLSVGENTVVSTEWSANPASSFSGPHHLASLLMAVSKDLIDSAVTNIPAPPNVNPGRWGESMRRVARSRPYLWRNHRDAIRQGYLEPGRSSAIGFPTGAGKSTLAELKINAALLSGRSVIFLCPTHALVEQTARGLSATFPTASVQGERIDEFGFISGDDELPEIFVMTPEACLAQMSVDPSVFEDVGLLVFDECHLLHPSDNPTDRRAVDAMLCVLILPRIAPEADFLLLSAMMKNTEDIAAWVEELTSRPCLALSLAWKPTRQLRGSVVYDQSTVNALTKFISQSWKKRTTKYPPVAVKNRLNAYPLAFFSLKQTWATQKRNDYTLVRLLEGEVRLSANNYWRLTPNAVAVSSDIAAQSVKSGLKTLVFFQTIKNAVSAANQISKRIGSASIKLWEEEARWAEIAITEMGDASHLFLSVKNTRVNDFAAVHHGLLMPEERALVESLYKRPNGLKVIAATSTLTQGMNFPSQLVIIGEDSRFDEAKDRREVLKAQELLNAAGRAGRAGEGATGIVLVVPGKVIGIDIDNATIGQHWTALRKVFGQSDQCLTIDDPLTAVLDRVHAGIDDAKDIDRYTIARLATGGSVGGDTANLSHSIRHSFGAYLSRKRHETEWVDARVQSALQFFSGQAPETEHEVVQNQVAASLGLSLELISRLSSSLENSGPASDATVPVWRRWFFRWLSDNPELLEHVCRPTTLAELFGKKKYEELPTAKDRANFALPVLSRLIWQWMRGDPLCEMEITLGTKPNKLKTCNGARRFVLRVIPELSFLFGLPALLHERSQLGKDEPEPVPSAFSRLGRCVKLGFNSHEKLALNQVMRKARYSRRQLHHHFASVKPFLIRAKPGETWEETLARVEKASEDELNARGFDE